MSSSSVLTGDVASNQVDATQLFPTFTPGRISKEILQQQIGSLVTTEQTRPSNADNGESDSGAITRGDSNTDSNTKQFIAKYTKDDTELIPNSVCETVFTMKYQVWGLRLRSPNEAWVHGGWPTTEFDLLERSGKVVHTVHAGCTLYGVSGMCVTDDVGLVYSDYDKQCIRSLSPQGQVSTLFTTEGSYPQCLCRLMTGELAVGMEGGVIRIYNAYGRVVRKIKSKHVRHPYYITINKLTEDIWVSDGCQKVVVFSKKGDHRFTYTGHGSDSTFYPHDLCSGRQGRLLITDSCHHRIHTVDQDGHFIQYLATQEDGIQCPKSIDVDDQGYAWVGMSDSRKVKIIKCLQ